MHYEDLEAYQERINDLFGKIPGDVRQIFEQKRFDLFVNQPGVDSLKEEDKAYVLTFDETFSATCDGVALFETINEISRTIDLTLKNKKIQIRIPKKKKKDLLIQTLTTVKEKFLCDSINS